MKEIKFRDLKANELECRVGTVKDGKGFTLLLYKTARADMQVLDETLGAYNWQCKYYQVKNTMMCSISIWDEEKKQWIEKCDGGDDDFNAEKVKGECSDAFKRAGFRLGIARKLYESPFIWIAETSDNNKNTRYEVVEIWYDDTSVTKLVIKNSKTGQVVFSYGGNVKVPPQAQKTQNNGIEIIKEYKKSLPIEKQEQFDAWLFNVSGETNIDKLSQEKIDRVVNVIQKSKGVK